MKLFLALAALLIINVSLFSAEHPGSTPEGIQVGSKAPEFTLKSVNGNTIRLADYKNKIVILDFWATWCGPCRRGIPDLVSIQKEFTKDVVVIGISVEQETKMEVPMFMQKQHINYPVVFATESVVNNYGGISGIPTSFIVDQNGNIADTHVGLVEKQVLVSKIKSLLKKK